MTFSEKLPELRRGQGLSQEELAAKIGVSRQAVSKWETGEAMLDLNKLLSLSEALGVSLDRLCGREDCGDEINPSVPEKKKCGIWSSLCAILAVLVFLLLLQISDLYKKENAEGSALVDVTAVETAFSSSNGHTLHYHIVPSAICEGYAYHLQLTPETLVSGAPAPITLDPTSGAFRGEISFPLTASQWSVSLRVNDGKNTYTVPVATQLRYTIDRLVSWTPVG